MSKPAGVESLTTQAYSRLYNAIIRAECVPGSKLKIEDLKNRYGIGTAPLREALSLLTSAGLVERIDQRGFRVAPVTRAEFADLLQSRCWLEGHCLTRSIRNGGRDWEERIVLAQYHLSRIARSQDSTIVIDEWETAHKELHMALIAASGSPILLDMADKLYDRNIRYRIISRRTAYPERNVGTEHDAIVRATLDRDEARAVELLTSHYSTTSAFLDFSNL